MTSRLVFATLLMAFILLSSLSMGLDRPETSEPLITYKYELYGDSTDQIRRDAGIQAVQSSIGRTYFSDFMLRGRSLLDAYVAQNWEQFAARVSVKSDEVRGGRRFARIEVAVDQEKLLDDLAEKRFFYRPAIRPLFYIFASETLDGQPGSPYGRTRLQQMINDRQYRYLWETGYESPSVEFEDKREVLVMPILSQNVAASPEALQEAADQAQRHEVEVFIAGSIATETVVTDKVYYDEYTFVETFCTLHLVRADTAEILASASVIRAAGNISADKAVEAATVAAIDEVGRQLFDAFDRQWGKTFLNRADARIMVLGLTPANDPLFMGLLQGVVPGVEVYTRGRYGDAAVLTITAPPGSQVLDTVLRETFFPPYVMRRVGEKEILLEAVSDDIAITAPR